MKKLLAALLLGLVINLSSAQSFLRAKQFTVGIKKQSGISWNAPTPSEVLIVVGETKINIHSKVKQEYRKVALLEQTKTTSKWRSVDAEGKACNIFMFTLPKYPGYLYVGVEYNDVIWYYTTTFE